MEAPLIFEEAKKRSIVEICERLGVELKSYPSGYRADWTPCCGRSRKVTEGRKGYSGRLWISPDDSTWKCHACGKGGSVVDFCAEIEHLDPLSAAKKLVETNLSTTKRKTEIDGPSPEERIKAARIIWRAAHRTTKEAENPCRKWLVEKRRIALEVVAEAERRRLLRYLPGDVFQATTVLKPHRDLLERIGEWQPDRKIPFTVYYPVLSPFYNGEGKVVGIEMRRIDEKEDVPKARSRGTKTGFWWKGEGNTVLVVEGIMDLLSAVTLGWKGHILGLPGSSSRKLVVELAGSHKEWNWILCFDSDEAGRKAAFYTALDLAVMKRKVNIVFPPEKHGKDLNDLLRSGERIEILDLPRMRPEDLFCEEN